MKQITQLQPARWLPWLHLGGMHANAEIVIHGHSRGASQRDAAALAKLADRPVDGLVLRNARMGNAARIDALAVVLQAADQRDPPCSSLNIADDHTFGTVALLRLTEHAGKLGGITRLQVVNTAIDDAALIHIGKWLPNLVILNLSRNPLLHGESIPELLGIIPLLTRLNVDDISLSAPAAAQLSKLVRTSAALASASVLRSPTTNTACFCRFAACNPTPRGGR